MGWLSARLVGQNRLVTEGGIIVAVTLLLTGTIWLVQQQIDESVYRSGKACVKRFIRRRLNKSDDKKAAVSGGAQRPQGNIIRSGKS